AFGPGVSGQHAELHTAVAHHVGIGGETALVAVEEIIHHEVAVVLHEIYHAKFDAELVGHGAGILNVLHPRAMADDIVLVDPVFHVRAHNVVPLPFQQERGNRPVDSAGGDYEDAFAG